MYSSVRDRPTGPPADVPSSGGDAPGDDPDGNLDGNVVALGATSFFTDISSEMVNAVLPIYLLRLGFSPLAFGLFDGVYQGMTGLLRIFGGLWADRRGRYKEVAGLGYALSAVGKIGLLVSSTVAPVTGVLLADRTGKGIRTAPRDALISLSSKPERMAEAFGIHRALDTAGAVLGPVMAFLILGVARDAYDAVFVTSFFVAVIGLGVLACFVRNRPRATVSAGPPPSMKAAVGLLKQLRFRRLVLAGGLLSVVTISDAFMYLTLERSTDMASSAFPLLFVGTASAYLLLAIPLGRLADRVGRLPVFLAGHVVLALSYLALRNAGPGTGGILIVLALLGAYYAATDGVLMAMTAGVVPDTVRTSGLGLLTTVTAIGRLVASGLFGLLWKINGPGLATKVFLFAIVVAIPAAALLLRPVAQPADNPV